MRKKLDAVIVRGAGDLATGSILRLHRAGIPVLALDIEKPTVIRRSVSFAPALIEGESIVEGVKGVKASSVQEIETIIRRGEIPILADPEGQIIEEYEPLAVVDAILAKKNLGTTIDMAPTVVGVGPGFTAGEDVDFVVETQRGHDLGRVLREGSAAPNTGIPGMIGGYAEERVLHAPAAGVFKAIKKISDRVEAGESIAVICTDDGEEIAVKTRISGVLRGILSDGLTVPEHFKLADVDPRDVESHCFSVSDKSNAIAGGVLEAVLSKGNILSKTWKDFTISDK